MRWTGSDTKGLGYFSGVRWGDCVDQNFRSKHYCKCVTQIIISTLKNKFAKETG